MEKLDDDIVGLMTRRAYDVAASSRGVKVYLNGTRIPIKNFKDYVDLFIKGKEDDAGNPLKVQYENCNPRWEVAVTLSDKGFQQMSFVNSIATTKVSFSLFYLILNDHLSYFYSHYREVDMSIMLQTSLLSNLQIPSRKRIRLAFKSNLFK